MTDFNGRWQIATSENFDSYMKAIGVNDDQRVRAGKFLSVESKMSHVITHNGNDWSMKTWTPTGERELKFTLGVEFDTATLDGRPVKAVFQMDGDKLVEQQKGDGFETTNIRTVDGDTLTLVLTGNNVSAKRTYNKID